MQKAKVIDNALPNGDFQDSSTQAALDGTIVRADFQNDNFNNLFEFVTGAGYDLIDDDLSQITKAAKGLYNPDFTYNTSGIASQSVSDIVRGSDGKYYEVQNDAVSGDNPVGSVTGNWELTTLDKNVLGLNNTTNYTPTLDYHPATKKFVEDTTGNVLTQDNILFIQDQKPNGVNGGVGSAGSFVTRDLNTVLFSRIPGGSLAANQITLPEGDYYVEISVPANFTNQHQSRLRNITDGSTILLGQNAAAPRGNSESMTHSFISGIFTLNDVKILEVQHVIKQGGLTSDLGLAGSFGTTEIYTDVKIWKVG